ncbi:hypothetical protein Lfu02_65370 [Longispora fulva]|nr:hypothetical protein Lfu02_65370 [Longispora fulva]
MGWRVPTAVVLAVLFVAVLLCTRAGAGPAILDRPLLSFLAERRTGPLTVLMTAITTLGSVYCLVPLAVLGALARSRLARSWWPAVVVLLAVGGTAVLTFAVKVVDGRARPPAGVVAVVGEDFSFPSGHTSNTTATIGVLTFLVYGLVRPGRPRVLLVTGAVLVMAAVGLSRLYLGVHWFTDVLGGYLLAGAWLLLVTELADRLSPGRPPSP